MNSYKPQEIEQKWQDVWDKQNIYAVDLNNLKDDQQKFYGFGMFNYPSGEGIHVGHVKNFTIPDVLLRYHRQRGKKVYAPVGFDSFGLPAENFALKTGTPPRETTDQAIDNYSKQYKSCGFSFDWSKVIDTSQPEYYKWTQWCFLQLYKEGLAYRKESSQWWCDSCKTVLADEQVINGKCWRHDGDDDPLIGRKSLRQWFFKITQYADEILKATDDLNWTPWVKLAQKNYIGKSKGVEIKFKLQGLKVSCDYLTVFTTALETIHGATFLVLAPEHPLVAEIINLAKNGSEVAEYVKLSQSKTEVDRKKAYNKTGVKVKGLSSLNPLTNKEIPIFIADYVLFGYGTGSIMAVPSADERDLEFATKYKLPVVYITKSGDFMSYKDMMSNKEDCLLKTDDDVNGLNLVEARKLIVKKLMTLKIVEAKTNFRIRDWLISRQRYWGSPIPIILCPACGEVPVSEKDLPVILPEVKDYKPSGDGRGPLAKVTSWLEVNCPKCGQLAKRETDTMDGYVCSSWYQMRYLSPNNSQKPWDVNIANKWFPVDFYNGADHATAHLIYARFFSRFFYDKNWLPTPEPFLKMYLHAKILAPDGQFFSKSKGNGINPLDIIEQGYGADALRVYICAVAPPDVEVIWSDQGVPAAYRFLNRTYNLIEDYLKNKYLQPEATAISDQLLENIYSCLSKVEKDIENLQYHTALAELMKLVNSFYKLAKEDGFKDSNWQFCLEILVIMLAPFAPHIASELWQKLGKTDSVHINTWPTLNQRYLQAKVLVLPIQVNGKLRGKLTIDALATQEEILYQAKQIEGVKRYLDDLTIQQEIYVKDKIVNFVAS